MCSKNDYTLVSDFVWYINVLSDFMTEGNFPSSGWQLLSDQFLDLALRVPATRSELIPVMSKAFELSTALENKPLLLAASHIISEYADTSAPIGIFLNASLSKAEERVQASAIGTGFKLYLACRGDERESAEKILAEHLPLLLDNSPPEVQDYASMTLKVLDIIHSSSEALEELQDALVGEMPQLGPLEAPAELLEPISLFSDLQNIISPKKKVVKKVKKVKKGSKKSVKDEEPEVEVKPEPVSSGVRKQRETEERVVILKRDDAPLAAKPNKQKESKTNKLANIDLTATVSETEAKAIAPKPYEDSSIAFARKKLSQQEPEAEHKKTTVRVRGRLAKAQEKKKVQGTPQAVTTPREGAREQALGSAGLCVVAKEFAPGAKNGNLVIELSLKNESYAEIAAVDVEILTKNAKIVGSAVVQGPIAPNTEINPKIELEIEDHRVMQTVQIRFIPSGSGEIVTVILRSHHLCS